MAKDVFRKSSRKMNTIECLSARWEMESTGMPILGYHDEGPRVHLRHTACCSVERDFAHSAVFLCRRVPADATTASATGCGSRPGSAHVHDVQFLTAAFEAELLHPLAGHPHYQWLDDLQRRDTAPRRRYLCIGQLSIGSMCLTAYN